MTRDAILAEIRKLPPEDHLELLTTLLREIAPSEEEEPIPDWHKEELDRILDDPTNVANLSWEEVRERLGIPRK